MGHGKVRNGAWAGIAIDGSERRLWVIEASLRSGTKRMDFRHWRSMSCHCQLIISASRPASRISPSCREPILPGNFGEPVCCSDGCARPQRPVTRPATSAPTGRPGPSSLGRAAAQTAPPRGIPTSPSGAGGAGLRPRHWSAWGTQCGAAHPEGGTGEAGEEHSGSRAAGSERKASEGDPLGAKRPLRREHRRR